MTSRKSLVQQLKDERKLIAEAIRDMREAVSLLNSLVEPDEKNAIRKRKLIKRITKFADTMETEIGNVYLKTNDVVVNLGRATAQRAEACRERDSLLAEWHRAVERSRGWAEE